MIPLYKVHIKGSSQVSPGVHVSGGGGAPLGCHPSMAHLLHCGPRCCTCRRAESVVTGEVTAA